MQADVRARTIAQPLASLQRFAEQHVQSFPDSRSSEFRMLRSSEICLTTRSCSRHFWPTCNRQAWARSCYCSFQVKCARPHLQQGRCRRIHGEAATAINTDCVRTTPAPTCCLSGPLRTAGGSRLGVRLRRKRRKRRIRFRRDCPSTAGRQGGIQDGGIVRARASSYAVTCSARVPL